MMLSRDESAEWIFQNCDLFFDPEEPLNASLYICLPRGKSLAKNIIGQMRLISIWSNAPEQIVPSSKRDVFKQQLKFIDAHLCHFDAQFIIISRFDHERFRSNAARWDCWKKFFDCGPHLG